MEFVFACKFHQDSHGKELLSMNFSQNWKGIALKLYTEVNADVIKTHYCKIILKRLCMKTNIAEGIKKLFFLMYSTFNFCIAIKTGGLSK